MILEKEDFKVALCGISAYVGGGCAAYVGVSVIGFHSASDFISVMLCSGMGFAMYSCLCYEILSRTKEK